MSAAGTVADFPPASSNSPPPCALTKINGAIRRIVSPANYALRNASVTSIGVLSLIWIAIVGCVDYCTGPEYTMLIFYLVPVTLGTWFVGRSFGMLLAVLSVVASSISDLVAGLPHIRYWNEAVGLASYVVFVVLLSRWRELLRKLDDRVRVRTADLQEEILHRIRLEAEMNEVTERERRRLGHDLHDSLCQHLTGTALSAQTLREHLAAERSARVRDAENVVTLLEEAIDLTRTLARGLLSADVSGDSLIVALESLAHTTTERFGIDCEFQHEEQLRCLLDTATSTQLYRIAQEAVTNAYKHAHPSRIIIELDEEPEHLALNVYDDGVGFAGECNATGLGLRMMRHGAEAIRATLSITRARTSGTVVSCTVANTDQMTGGKRE